MADDKDQRIQELLEANNRYLEEGREARREVARLNRLFRVLIGDGEVELARERAGRMLLRAELTQNAQGVLAVGEYRVYREGTVIYRTPLLDAAHAVYVDNVENMLLEPV